MVSHSVLQSITCCRLRIPGFQKFTGMRNAVYLPGWFRSDTFLEVNHFASYPD